MKKLIFLSLIIGIFVFSSCEEKKDDETNIVSHSGCKNNEKSFEDPEEYIIQAVSNSSVNITHKNVIFNCCPGDLYADIDGVGTQIYIDEGETNPICNCLCPYDIEYSIGNLTNQLYSVTLSKEGLPVIQFDFQFHFQLDTVIVIQ